MIDNLFLSVGAMKAGTTWLYEQLKDHPDIYFTPEKEIHYFANKVGIEKQLNHRNRILKLKEIMSKCAKGNPKFIAENIDEIAWYANYAHPKEITNEWYETLFLQNKEKQFCADFSNLYCQMDSDGWENVHKLAKNVKVIYTLRDPLSRLWSHYKFHMKWVNREDEAIDVGFEHFKELLNKPWFWVNAEYAKNFNKLKKCLPEKNLKLLYFEDFRESPNEELRKVQDFIGVERAPVAEENFDKKVNATKSFQFPDKWGDLMRDKLYPLCKEMKECGIWHPKWNNL